MKWCKYFETEEESFFIFVVKALLKAEDCTWVGYNLSSVALQLNAASGAWRSPIL